MSRYINRIGDAIENALSQVPSAQPSQVAGYWANRDFWLCEFQHLLDTIDGYDQRLAKMKTPQDLYVAEHGGREHNRDEFGEPYQHVRDTTKSSTRRSAASNARTVLKALADRALDLGIASTIDYDAFNKRLRVSGRDQD